MNQATGEHPVQTGRTAWLLLVPLLAGAVVAVTLGVYGRLHEPTGVAVNLAGFSGPLAAKVWLTTGALGFGLVQVVSALVMYGKVPRVALSRWTPAAHRWSGRLAFLLAVPVAVHCLYAVGLQTFSGGAPDPPEPAGRRCRGPDRRRPHRAEYLPLPGGRLTARVSAMTAGLRGHGHDPT